MQALSQQEPAEYRVLAGRLSFDEAQLRAALAESLAAREVRAPVLAPEDGAAAVTPNTFLITESGWLRLSDRVGEMLISYHRQFPLRPGMSKEELKSRLKLPPRFFTEALAAWGREGAIAESDTTVRLPDHEVRLTPDQQKTADAFLTSLRTDPYSPPNDHLPDHELLAALVGRGEIVRVSESVVFDAQAYQTMVDQIVRRLREQGKITVAEVRDMFGTSRKYALALMEHLDETKVTLRMGDERVLRRG
ncbi:MAG TPA: SelB C-terminal domain-containing protein [Dehalococcoidia bacterium]|nr:SelB C-terminal domain-containing protein [Dehalococcoidia bacterium]